MFKLINLLNVDHIYENLLLHEIHRTLLTSSDYIQNIVGKPFVR